MSDVLQRQTFRTSRLLDFFSEKELVAQTGHQVAEWPLVVVKELIDNALDACEETGVAPVISVTVNEAGIEVRAIQRMRPVTMAIASARSSRKFSLASGTDMPRERMRYRTRFRMAARARAPERMRQRSSLKETSRT